MENPVIVWQVKLGWLYFYIGGAAEKQIQHFWVPNCNFMRTEFFKTFMTWVKFSILKFAVDQTSSETFTAMQSFFWSTAREKYIALLMIKKVSGGSGTWKAPELTMSWMRSPNS